MVAMRLGLSLLYALSRPLRSALADLPRAAELGVELVELVDEDGHRLDRRRVRMVKRVLSGLGLEAAVHGPFVDMNIGSPHEPTRRFMLRRHLRSMEAAAELGAVAWVFHPGLLTGLHMHFPGAEWDAMLRSVRELAARAEELGLTILIENGPEPVPFLLKTAAQFRRFFEDLGEGVRLGVAFDVGHAHICGQVEELLRALAGRIGHVHAHDNNGRQDEHLAIGEGTVDWPGVLEGLRAVGYDGPVVVESVRKPFESLKVLSKLLENEG